MVKPKNVTISTSSANNLCSQTNKPFEEPDGMTDIDLHEIISCQSTSDTKSISKSWKRNVPKLLFTIGTGFMIITCIVLTLLLIDDSLTWPIPPNPTQQRNTNFQKSLTLNELSMKNKKSNMNKFESIKQNDITEDSNNQHYKIKRDISSVDMNNLQAADSDSRVIEPHKNSKFLNTVPNENAIENTNSIKWRSSGKSSSYTYFNDTVNGVNEIITTTDNILNHNRSSENQPISSSLITDASEFSHGTVYTSASALREDDYTRSIENYERSTHVHQPTTPILGSSKNENQTGASRLRDSNSEEYGDHERILTTTPIDSSITTDEFTSTFDNWENKRPSLTEPPIDNLGKTENDILPTSRTASYEIISLFPSSDNENQSDTTKTGDANLEEDRGREAVPTSASIYSQKSTHDFTSTVANWENKNAFDLTQRPIDYLEETGNDIPPTSTTASYVTISLLSGSENENLPDTTRTGDDNSAEDRDHWRIPSSAPIYFQESTNDFTSTVANWKNKIEFGVKEPPVENLEKIGIDILPSSTTGAYETGFLVASSEDENQSNATRTRADNAAEDRNYEYKPSSTPIYSQEPHDFTSTVVNWENKNEWDLTKPPLDHLKEIGSNIPPTSTTASYESISLFASSEDEKQLDATRTWADNTAEYQNYEHNSSSTPVYSQEQKQDFTSTVANGKNKNEFGVTEPTVGNLEEMGTDILPSSTVAYETTSLFASSKDENQSDLTRTVADHTAKDRDYEHNPSSTPIYSQEQIQDFTSTVANWESKNEFGVTEPTEDNLEEIGNDILQSSTTVAYEIISLLSSSEYENQSHATRTVADNTAEDRDYEQNPASTPIYSQEEIQDFTSTVANLKNKNGFGVKEPTVDNLEEMGNEILPSSTTSTVAYETISLFASSRDEHQLDSRRTGDDNLEEDRDFKTVPRSASIYSQESKHDFTSIGAWEYKNELDLTQPPLDILEEIGTDIPPTPTTTSYETISLFASSENENQSDATRTWADNAAEDRNYEHNPSSTPIYSQEQIQDFTSTDANWKNKNAFGVQEPTVDNLEELGNDILPPSTTVAYETISLFASSENENQLDATRTGDDNLEEDRHFETVPKSASIYSQESTHDFTSIGANWENKIELDLTQPPLDNLEEIGTDIPPTSTTTSYETISLFASSEDENQSKATRTWADNAAEDRDYEHNPSSTPIYSQERTRDFTSTVANWENKNEFGVQEPTVDNLEELGNDILPPSTTVAYETISLFASSENENQLDATRTGDDNLEEDRHFETVPKSASIYSQESTHDFTSIGANWENKIELDLTQPPLDNLEEIGTDIPPTSTTTSYETISLFASSEDENQSKATRTWADNAAEDRDYEHNPSSTPIYSQERTRDFTSTVANWENKNEFGVTEPTEENLQEIGNDILPSSTTVAYETISLFSSSEYENRSHATRTGDDNLVEDLDFVTVPTSTSVYSEESTHDFTSYWENKNELDLTQPPIDNLEEIGNDILPTSTTASFENISGSENDNQSGATTTGDDNTAEDRDYEHIPSSTPIYSQELTHHFISTIANWENENEFGVKEPPVDILKKIGNYILPSSTAVAYETISLFPTSGDENQSNATSTWADNTTEDREYMHIISPTPIYSQESTHGFSSTVASWENKNQFGLKEPPLDNLERIGNDILSSSTTVAYERISLFASSEDENQSDPTRTGADNTAEDSEYELIISSTPIYSQESTQALTSTVANWEDSNEFGVNEPHAVNSEKVGNDIRPSLTTVAYETISLFASSEHENQSDATQDFSSTVANWEDSNEFGVNEPHADNSGKIGNYILPSSTTVAYETISLFASSEDESHSDATQDFTSTVANWEDSNEFGVNDPHADNSEKIGNDILPSSTTVAYQTISLFASSEDESHSDATRDFTSTVANWEDSNDFGVNEPHADNSEKFGNDILPSSTTVAYETISLFASSEDENQSGAAHDFTSTVANWENKNEFGVKEPQVDILVKIGNDILPSSTVAYDTVSLFASSEGENQSYATRTWTDNTSEDRDYGHILSSAPSSSQESTLNRSSTVPNWQHKNEVGVKTPHADNLEMIGNDIFPSSTTIAYKTTSLLAISETQSDATREWDDNSAEDRDYGHILSSTPIYSHYSTFQNWENNNGVEPKSEGSGYELTSTMPSGDFFTATSQTTSTIEKQNENILGIGRHTESNLDQQYELTGLSANIATTSKSTSTIENNEIYETVDGSSSTTTNVVSYERARNTNINEGANNAPISLPPFISDFHKLSTTNALVTYVTENINGRWYKNNNLDANKNNELESTAVDFDVFESANNDLDSYDRTKSSTNNYFNEKEYGEDVFSIININPVSDGYGIINISDNHESENLVPSVNGFSDIDKYQLESSTVVNSLDPDHHTNNAESTTHTNKTVRPFISDGGAVAKYMTLNLSRFNRKASALRNRTGVLKQNNKGLAKHLNREAEYRFIATTENNLDSTSLPLNVRWSGQEANNFENMKIAAKDFATVNEHLQSNQQSSVNQNFGKAVCPTFISPMGFPVLQQPSAFPYLYNSNQASPYTNVMPYPIPRAETNPYIAQQYPYIGTNSLPSYSKAMMQQSGYLMYNVNGQNIMTPSAGGQYYICNPVPNVLGNSNTDGISQVEIRKSVNDINLQSLASENLENRTRASQSCPFGERSCEDDSKCIKTHHFCDGEVQCKDASDEAFCPCKSRVGKARECDGYFDCPNGEDESKCFGCEANMFSCDDWSQNDRAATCIPAEQRCDGIPQCPTEKDEHDCSILTRTFSEKQHFIVSTTVGFLYRNFKGRYYPACRNPESWANEACQSAAGPSTMAPLTHLVPVDVNYNGPYISASSKEDIKISHSCEPGAAIFVECPPLVCGMRKKIRNPYRMEEVDTSAEQILSQFQRTKEPSELKDTTDNILGDGRVVGGKPSQAEAWPWIVSVYRNGVFHCGGALINELWIVTAGHCVEKYWHYYYEIQAGVLRRYSYAPMVQNRMVSHIIGHRLYDRTKLKNDLALMKMSKSLSFGRYVRPICLPSEITAGKNFKWGPEPGTVCTAVGWGATVEHGSDPDHLREVEVPILKHCKHREDQEGNEICAGLMEGGKDACQGDSGGPFMCRNPNAPNQWYLAGIVSHGEGCARPNEPGVYTRVSLFLEWIYENIRAEMVPQTRPLHRCPGYICRKTNRCIANKRRCNKVVDCLLGDDEMHCDKNDFNEIFKHAMRHMLLRSRQDHLDNNGTTNSPITRLNEKGTTLLVPTQTNVPNTDVIETSTTMETTSPDTFSSNQSYNKNFVCKRILQTIDISKQCDKTTDCEDATDEQNCTCVSYLRISHPQAICDGVTDCFDMTDETNCHDCKQNEYHCRQSNICIIKEKRCNNVPDCPWEEDEWDCFALTNGKTITLDGDLRPYLNGSGLVSFNHNGTWRPVCGNWTGGIEATMAADTCFYLGFSDYRSFLKVPVYDNPLQIIQKSAGAVADMLPIGSRCTGLFIKCSDVIDVTHLTEHANISKIINTMQGNPWNAEIYVNGKFKCTGSILDVDWIITSTSCFEKDFKLDSKYVAVLLGRSKTYLNVMGPHEQVIRIIESIQVSDSDIILLRLSNKINISRYIRPIRFSVRDYIVSERETCIALGQNFDNFTESVILQAVSNCTFGFRCFKRTRSVQEFCQNKSLTSWSGSIVCQSKHGWYPAAVFHESRGSCGFTTTTAYTSVQYWRANINKLMKQAAVAIDAPICKGFRCSLGHCLEEHNICDGIPDCRDAGDENPNYCSEKRKQCSASSSCVCLKSELKCQNGKCVPKTAFCDTNNDCGDWSDEPESCNCRSYLALTNPKIVCDGIRNCQDRTDEDPHLCSCKGYHFVCGESNHCIPQDMVCDGVSDCPNGHDEAHCISLTSAPGSPTTEVQVRTAGIWHPGCFPKYLTTLQLESICKKIGYRGGSAIRINNTANRWKTGWRPVADPFLGILIHHTAKRNVIIAIRAGNKPFVSLQSDINCFRLFLECS